MWTDIQSLEFFFSKEGNLAKEGDFNSSLNQT